MTSLVLAILMQAPMVPEFPEPIPPIPPMPIERFGLWGEEVRVKDPVYHKIIF